VVKDAGQRSSRGGCIAQRHCRGFPR
jgi:hypothetical protein